MTLRTINGSDLPHICFRDSGQPLVALCFLALAKTLVRLDLVEPHMETLLLSI